MENIIKDIQEEIESLENLQQRVADRFEILEKKMQIWGIMLSRTNQPLSDQFFFGSQDVDKKSRGVISLTNMIKEPLENGIKKFSQLSKQACEEDETVLLSV